MRQFELRTVVLFGLSISFHGIMFLVFHQRNWFAFPMDLHRSWLFADFLVFTQKYKVFHTGQFFSTGFPMVYPTPIAALFAPFFKLPAPFSLWAMLAFSALALLLPALLFGRHLHRQGLPAATAYPFVLVCMLLSWPALLIFNGANSEVFVWVALAVAMWAFATGRLWLAAVFFGLAASLKLFPIVFFALFLKRGQLAKFALAIGSFFASFWLALWYVGPTVSAALNGFFAGMKFAQAAYFSDWRDLEHGVDHSLFGLIKFIGKLFNPHGPTHFAVLLQPCQALTALGGLALYAFRIRKLPLLNQVLCFSVISIYFTAFSGDGTLIHLYYPLAMLFLFSMEADRRQWAIPGLHRILGCMVFCLSFETFLVLPVARYGLRIEGPAHAIALGLMLFWALRYPMQPPATSEPSHQLQQASHSLA